MLKRTCSPGYTKAHSRIMQTVPRIAAVDQHKALAVIQEVKEDHCLRQHEIANRLEDIEWRGGGRAYWLIAA